jgi:hypothetical protein
MSVSKIGAAGEERALRSAIRNSLRRDGSLRGALESGSESVATDIEATLQRVSSLSLTGIDSLVQDLQTLRERLAEEGERIRREVAEYAFLSQSSMQSTKVIAESLAHFKTAVDLRPGKH